MMMYTNLFNPNYKVNTDSREWNVRYKIHYDLKHIIELCKRGNKTVAQYNLIQFRGALYYMVSVNDIDEMTNNLLYGITKQITKKYDLKLYY